MAIDEDRVLDSIIDRVRHFRTYDRYGNRRPTRITQEDLGDRLGVSRITVANLENRRKELSVPLLYSVCEALGVGLDDVLPSVGDMRSSAPPRVEWAGKQRALRAGEEKIAARLASLSEDGDEEDA